MLPAFRRNHEDGGDTFLRIVSNHLQMSTRHHNPEQHDRHFHRSENLKSHRSFLFSAGAERVSPANTSKTEK
jgi:hypothetical protein